MIAGNESVVTYTRGNLILWFILAFQGGLINMGGLLACQSFVSHVTGYATRFGMAWTESSFLHALAILLVPGFFLTGSMISGVLVDLRLKLGKKPKYYIVFGVLFVLLLLVVIGGFNHLFGVFGEPLQEIRDYTLLALLCLVCGIQNGTVTLVSRSVVRTTHLTGLTTDLGIGLVRVLNRRRLRGKIQDEGRANLMRIGIILFFVFGSVAGVKIFRTWEFRGFIFPCGISGILFFATVYYQVIRLRLRVR
ncbi:MAG: YoaK family protein [Bdellovibrionales bacterium]